LAAAASEAYAADGVPFTPYGMDAVPGAVFYERAWDRYGSDPVPAGVTSDLGFRDVYGLDAIPEAVIPSLHEQIRQVFPHHLLQVLTSAQTEIAPRQRPSRRPAPRQVRPAR
jgi:hypothetical protein